MKKKQPLTETAGAAEHTEPGRTPLKKAPMRFLKIVLAAVILILIAYFGFTTVVREGNCAVILRFGAPRQVITEAGLYFRLPWPFESVVTYENRLQYLESNYLETTTRDKRNVILQSYVLWEVSDPLLYHNSVGSQNTVDSYIKDQVFSATNSVMGAYDLSALVSLESESIKTEEIQERIFRQVQTNCEANYGIAVIDVSILRISLPDTNLQSVFEQMKADRQKDINTILANAERDANKITSEADAEASEIIANGTTEAAAIRAATEKEVAEIYANAQAANIELYQFLRNLDTLVSSVNSNSILVVKADSYPFNVLLEYSDLLKDDSDAGNNTVIADLNYILPQLSEEDRNALIEAIRVLLEEAAKNSGATT